MKGEFFIRSFGIETEFSIVPDNASKLLYPESGFAPNMSRNYKDMDSPESSTPECNSFRQLVAYDKAGERIMVNMALAHLREFGKEILLLKNNRFRNGRVMEETSRGCHENYLTERTRLAQSEYFEKMYQYLGPYLITRIPIIGNGYYDEETREYEISQRASFIKQLISIGTVSHRGIINSKDEPHADKCRYRRLHVITGDSNMSEIQTYMKIGMTHIILRMIEDDVINSDTIPEIRDPINTLHLISKDLRCSRKFELEDGTYSTAIEIQRRYLELATNYLEQTEATEEERDVLRRWDTIVSGLEQLEDIDEFEKGSDYPNRFSRQLDWVIKYSLLRAAERREIKSKKIKNMLIQYHNIQPVGENPTKSSYYRLLAKGGVDTIVTEDEINLAMTHPPPGRARLRKVVYEAIKRENPNSHIIIDWENVLLGGSLKRIQLRGDPRIGIKGERNYETLAEIVENQGLKTSVGMDPALLSEILNGLDL